MWDDVLKAQHGFARKASAQPAHRFDNLYYLLKRDEWLLAALDAVLANTGARTGGVDYITRRDFERAGFRQQFIAELKDQLRNHYEPQPVKRQYIPKGSSGKLRPLGIPTIRDRVVQMLLKMVLEPIFESDFLNCSCGFRPGRRTMDAIQVCYRLINPHATYFWIIEGDIRSYFDNVNHDILLKLMARRVADTDVLNLIGRILDAGVMEAQVFRRSPEGTPQGGIISPLCANLYLHELDKFWWERYGKVSNAERHRRRQQGKTNCIYMRYADDWIALCNGTKAQAEAVREEIRDFLHDTLQLELSDDKTVVTHACDGFDFLGFHIQHYPTRSGRKAITLVRPSDKSIARLKDKVRDMTSRTSFIDNPMFKFMALNAVLRGWMNYYRHCNTSRIASWLDHWVYARVANWLKDRHKTGYREMLKQYLKQEGPRKNFAVKQSGGSNLFLFLMRDVPIVPYRARTIPHPYLKEQPDITAASAPEIPIPDHPWNGRTESTEWRNLRDEVLERDGHRCTTCGTNQNLDVHHIRPKREGGKDILENLITLCKPCHIKLGGYGSPRQHD